VETGTSDQTGDEAGGAAARRASGPPMRPTRSGAPRPASIRERLLGWARARARVPYLWTDGCCAAAQGIGGWRAAQWRAAGLAPPGAVPAQADVLVVAAVASPRQMARLRDVWLEMREPRWVVAVGACACSGGPIGGHATGGDLSAILPVDVFVPGCPPRPDAVLDGLRGLAERVAPARRRPRESGGRPE